MKTLQVISIFFIVMLASAVFAQKNDPKHPSVIRTGVFLGETPPLRDLARLTPKEIQQQNARAESKRLNKKLRNRSYPFAATAQPQGPDPVWQQTMGAPDMAVMAPLQNFEGQSSPYYPPDECGAAGPNHYFQAVNCTYAIYSKTGSLLAGPTNLNTLFTGVTGATYNDGDPIVLYDEMADRWFVSEFSISGSNNYMLIAVSSTNDPTGTWYKYSFDVDDMPDYPKFGIWHDGYYMGVNNSSGKDVYVFQRSVMLTGGASPQMVGFDNSWRPTTIDGFSMIPAVDCDGTTAPTGPGLFIGLNDDAIGGGSDQLWIYELSVNWTTPSSSTFTRSQQINVAAFDSNFGNNWTNIKQPGTGQELDAVPQVIMNVPQYRNFGSYQTIVCCHSVDVDATDHAGVRWYELRKTGAGSWTVRQQGTYAPDAHSRWMGSIMMSASGKLGLGYSISSGTVYPGIRYTGQSSAAYAAGNSTLDMPEEIIYTGTNSQTGAERWGDYSQMSVDPSDNETFWYTNAYIGSGGSRKTKIASFKIGNAPIVTTTAASVVTTSTATLNGTVNPNTLATTAKFEWGTTISYGNTTTVQNMGNGTSAVALTAPLTGLTAGTTYHYRAVGINADGTTYGADMTFTPGAATVTTTAVTGITLTAATSGGNVTSDGGSPITARGVCWGTSTNPTIAGNHTTDGSGTGSFVSNLTGLSSNTSYFVRAYATNSSGTYYGENISFSTLCGIYSLPFTENFNNTSIPGCWSQLDNQGNGQIWQFGTITGQSPNPSLTGNYAYLNSDAYGSGNSQNADLITPTIDMTGMTNVTLAFSHYYKHYGSSSAKLYYSINNGSTWTLIQSWSSTTSTNPTSFSQVIAAVANQSQVKFKWNYSGSFAYYWAIDNISITGTSSNTLSVTPANQNVNTTAGSTSFNVTSNTTWTAVSDQTWCTVTPSGTGNGTITANYTANAGVARTANITVAAPGATSVIVTVSQAGVAPTLSVTPGNQNVTTPAGATSFTVTSNSNWNVVSDQTWCTVTSSGSGNGSITANYTENLALTPRVANITVTVTGLTPVVVTVTQAAAAPALAVTPPSQSVASIAGTTSFTVTSNTSWAASSDQTWCTVTASGSGNGTIQANFTDNSTINPRTANITVTATGVTPVVVTVVQAAAGPALVVTPSNQNVPSISGSTSFTVSSNLNWSALSNSTWCVVTASGTGNGTITANYTENTDFNQRIATITVSGSGVPDVIVTVSQSGTTPTLAVSPSNQNVTPAAGNTTFNVTSNTTWNVVSDALWCTVPATGTGNGTLNAVYTENTLATPRTAHLTFSAAGTIDVVVTVSQAGALPQLGVTPTIQNVTSNAGTSVYTVSSNTDWFAETDATWVTVTSSGSGNGSIEAQYEENTGEARIANITVTAAGALPVVVQLSQSKPVGVDLVITNELSVYPNPSNGLFALRSKSNKAFKAKIDIIDMAGQVVLSLPESETHEHIIDLRKMPKATYYLKSTIDGKVNFWKIITY
jgi:hypothetical protein